jgi:hypothetical protein
VSAARIAAAGALDWRRLFDRRHTRLCVSIGVIDAARHIGVRQLRALWRSAE